jgi:hypothetical protein
VSESEGGGTRGGGDGSADGSAIRGLDAPPPFWSRWSQLYWFVAGLLVFDILVMWFLTRWAS